LTLGDVSGDLKGEVALGVEIGVLILLSLARLLTLVTVAEAGTGLA